MENNINDISKLLHEVAETHHLVYKITDGADPDWAVWYANHLIDLTEFQDLIGINVLRSELIYSLVKLDKEFTAKKPDGKWEDYYALELYNYFKNKK